MGKNKVTNKNTKSIHLNGEEDEIPMEHFY